MQLYLPIAEISISVEAVLALGLSVGFLSGLFGVGGGFLTTPFLIFLGVPPAIAVGTQTTQLVASSVTGVLGHWQSKNVDLKIAAVMLVGGIFGSFIGVFLFKLLEMIGQIDVAIRLLYVVLLGSIGSLMMFESLNSLLADKQLIKKEASSKPSAIQRFQEHVKRWPYKVRFPESKLYISALVPAGIGFIGGILASLLGIGGGFILVPAMLYLLGMPATLVAGTCLFQVIFTTGFAAIMHAVTNQTVDLVLATLLIFGGVIGAQIGVRSNRFVSGLMARLLLASIILIVCIALTGQLFIAPQNLYVMEVRY